jgi:CO/xanthine dehydrogenase Mo-binding subunit
MTVSSAEKAAGRLDYVLDLSPRDALHACLIRARGPHSIVTVDRAALRALPDVVAVLDATDDPGQPLFSTNPYAVRQDTSVFAREARFAGDVVGAVVARTRAAARAAARRPVEERSLPAVLSVEQARADGAPPAHRGFGDNRFFMLEVGMTADELNEHFAASEHVFDDTYLCDAAAHTFLEPAAAIASWDAGGGCRIIANAQLPNLNRRLLASILGLAPERIDYVSPAIGGSFGGKEEFLLDAAAALCSRAVDGRPVVLATDRAETTAGGRTRHAMRVRVRTGCSASGGLTARLIEATAECGPYAGHSPNVVINGLSLALTLYPAPAVRGVAECVALNRVPPGPYRGYGGPQLLFAVESQLDEIARTLALDPLDLRAGNALRRGDADPTYGWPVSFDLAACLRIARRRHPRDRPDAAATGVRRRRGWGVAALANISGLTGVLATPDSATVRCTIADGRLHVTTACPDMGQGLHRVLARVCAAELGLPERLVDVDCDARLADIGAAASRGSFLTANAALEAARDLRARIGERVPVAPVSRRLDAALDGLSATGTFSAPDNALVAGVQLAHVEVDCATGQVIPLRLVSIHDAGRLLDPARARDQVRGGVIEGLGLALGRPLRFDAAGTVVASSLHAQGLPPADWPVAIDAVFLDAPHPTGPLGSKGLGEAPAMGVAAAVANAIRDATGARLRTAPFTPDRVLDAILSVEESELT